MTIPHIYASHTVSLLHGIVFHNKECTMGCCCEWPWMEGIWPCDLLMDLIKACIIKMCLTPCHRERYRCEDPACRFECDMMCLFCSCQPEAIMNLCLVPWSTTITSCSKDWPKKQNKKLLKTLQSLSGSKTMKKLLMYDQRSLPHSLDLSLKFVFYSNWQNFPTDRAPWPLHSYKVTS